MNLTEEQQKLAINLVKRMVDGCQMSGRRVWLRARCADDNGLGYDCPSCAAREFLKSIGESVTER